MATKGVHQHRPLPYQQVARSVQHQYGLLFSGLDGHKAHCRPAHSLADRRGVGRVGFAALERRSVVARLIAAEIRGSDALFSSPLPLFF
jgi:hypothetical protein